MHKRVDVKSKRGWNRMKQQILIIVSLLVILAVYYQQAYATSEPQIQQGKMGFYYGCHGIVVPGNHTLDYLRGYALGAQNCHLTSSNSTANSDNSTNANSSNSSRIIRAANTTR
jgi:hypothetical protein